MKVSEESSEVSSGKWQVKLGKVILVVSLIANAVLVSLYVQKNEELKRTLQDPAAIQRQEVAKVVDEVSKLITLPAGVEPNLATVTNAASLSTRQPFFENAEDGDKLLLYTNTTDPTQRKAYLYRPSTKQLVNVAPVNLGGQIQTNQDEYTIRILNGTSNAGLEDKMETLLKGIYPNAQVITKDLAQRLDYKESQLVRVGASEDLAAKVAGSLGVSIVNLPEGENDPGDVDFVLILGGVD